MSRSFDGQYKKPTPDMDKFEGFGHFTQVVSSHPLPIPLVLSSDSLWKV